MRSDLAPARPGVMWPFAAVTAAGVLGALLPGSRLTGGPMALALVTLAIVAAATIVVHRSQPTSWLALLPAIGYFLFVALLLTAQGGLSTGSVTLLLVPVLWAALFRNRADSAIVVAGAITTIAAMTAAEHDVVAVFVRRAVLWGAMCGGVSVASHMLRAELGHAVARRDELLRQMRTLQAATERLTAITDPDEVLLAATELAHELAAEPGHRRRAAFFTVTGRRAALRCEVDDAGVHVGHESFDLAEDPLLQRAADTGIAVNAASADEHLIDRACVPVQQDGRVAGVLAVGSNGQAISETLFGQLVALGHIVDLALANALRNQRLHAETVTDGLTGLANRRGFDAAVAALPRAHGFAIVLIDLDGLKQINDTFGHAVGDQVIASVGAAIRAALRRSDTGARIGGDEFALVVNDADHDAAARVVARMTEALETASINGITPRVSAGIAIGREASEVPALLLEADAAMYEAKRARGAAAAL